MPFPIPKITEIHERVKTDIDASLGEDTPILRKAVVWVLAKVFAGIVWGLYAFIKWGVDQLFPDTADLEYVIKLAQRWIGNPKPATYTQLEIAITGTDGTDLPSGTRWVGPNKVFYKVEDDVTISGGTANALVTAETSGTVANLSNGRILTIVNTIIGINSTAQVLSTEIIGVEAESKEEIATRLTERFQNPPHGGNLNDYIRWAKEVPGVTRAWSFRNYLGSGTVGVMFVLDGVDPIIPIPSKVQEVKDYIEEPGRRPATVELYVFAPTPVPIDFAFTSLTPDTPAIRNLIASSLADFISRNVNPNTIMYLSQLNEVISGVTDEVDHKLSLPSGDTPILMTQLPQLGDITWPT